jgi:HD-GYP domain-containing protein (c-di-GMP phosphodiesterase class II)
MLGIKGMPPKYLELDQKEDSPRLRLLTPGMPALSELPNGVPQWASQAVESLLISLRARDAYTYGHSRRVGRLAGLLAKEAGLDEYQQKVCEYSGLLHDIGKIGIPDDILLKPGRLTTAEIKIIKEHPIKSEEVIQKLCDLQFFESILPGLRSHHERPDGQGYPDNLKGNQVPFLARLVSVVDTYDAITTSRTYKEGLSDEFAYRELAQCAGPQFDEKFVELFLRAHPLWSSPEEEISEKFVAEKFAA